VNDISVSRLHASIKYTEDDFYLFDNNSKFGTLVLVKDLLEIKKDTVFLQCGKTVVTVGLKTVKTKSPQICPETIEMQDGIGTPSTTHNDNDVDNNTKLDTETLQSTNLKKRRGRPKKHVIPISLDKKMDELNISSSGDISLLETMPNEEIFISKTKKITKKRRSSK